MTILQPCGGPTWARTRDRPVMSRELYQLSYGPTRSTTFYSNMQGRHCQELSLDHGTASILVRVRDCNELNWLQRWISKAKSGLAFRSGRDSPQTAALRLSSVTQLKAHWYQTLKSK